MYEYMCAYFEQRKKRLEEEHKTKQLERLGLSQKVNFLQRDFTTCNHTNMHTLVRKITKMSANCTNHCFETGPSFLIVRKVCFLPKKVLIEKLFFGKVERTGNFTSISWLRSLLKLFFSFCLNWVYKIFAV